MTTRIDVNRTTRHMRGGNCAPTLYPVIVLAAVVALVSGALACRAANSPAKNPAGSAATTERARSAPETGAQLASAAKRTVAVQTPSDTVEMTLGPTGFAPPEVGHAAGRFNLRVKNRSGEREIVLRLSDANGEKLTEARLTDKVREWVSPVELAAGAYVLSEAGHPGWTCRIVVTAQ